ncbi:hypothetical protein H1P_1890009 [Hyella patelloides LEGE 07179]|uniref:Uncharacterized protein n=1 Tax=Hyella patelloides LEGE 07179 TaxID=945734 RepID=A0A563VP59_9CYAN|nr:hypothetical protein [Hyella patelloides]VEP13194.1 hypothetical protein H1P_1890009 [Hyella patelloides LEGE 07179]
MHITPCLLIPFLSGMYLLSVYILLRLCQLKGFQSLLSSWQNNADVSVETKG